MATDGEMKFYVFVPRLDDEGHEHTCSYGAFDTLDKAVGGINDAVGGSLYEAPFDPRAAFVVRGRELPLRQVVVPSGAAPQVPSGESGDVYYVVEKSATGPSALDYATGPYETPSVALAHTHGRNPRLIAGQKVPLDVRVEVA